MTQRELSWLEQLQRRSLQADGFDRNLDGKQSAGFRKVAWLYLLGVTDDLAVEDDNTPAKVTAGSLSLSRTSRSDCVASQASSASSRSANDARSDTLADSVDQPVSTPASSPRLDLVRDGERIPLDTDGWQIPTLEAVSIDDTAGASGSAQQQHQQHGLAVATQEGDQWETVSSKKAKALQRRRNSKRPPPQLDEETEKATLAAPGPDDANKAFASSSLSPSDSPAAAVQRPSPAEGTTKTSKMKKKGKKGAAAKADPSAGGSLLASLAPHRDEEQVDKDIRRSFVGPAFASQTAEERALRRKQLEEVVLFVLRRHPSLSYYQGYHDVISVLVVALSSYPLRRDVETTTADSPLWTSDSDRDHTVAAAEKLSLHFVRDSMTHDLDPIMGHLKLLCNLVRTCDASLASTMETASSLPFFALSWLLTMFAHDLEEQGLVQRFFDFILSHGPASVMYCCAAVVLLSKREEVEALDDDEREDPAMLHMTLSRLPRFTLDEEESLEMVEAKGLYEDPDVDTPSSRVDGIAAGKDKTTQPMLALTRFLSKAKELMLRHPLSSSSLGANKVMGCNSVLFTWSNHLSTSHTPQEWEQLNILSERIMDDISSIVLDSKPTPPPSSSFEDEKMKRHKLLRYDDNKTKDVVLGTLVAVVGVAGVMMVLYVEGRERGQVNDLIAIMGRVVGWLGGGVRGPGM